jgi:hypothetical protein
MLVAARLRYVAGTRWGSRRYLDMDRLWEADQEAGSQKSTPTRPSQIGNTQENIK